MQKIIVFRGCPRSGKTTKAREMQAKNPNIKIICRDDYRLQLTQLDVKCGVDHKDKKLSKRVSALWRAEIIDGLRAGNDLIIADTNLYGHWKSIITNACDEAGVEYELIIDESFMDVPLIELIIRNERSGCEMLPESVLYKFYNDNIMGKHFIEQDKSFMPVVIFDVDGTLALKSPDRNIYDVSKVNLDLRNDKVANLLSMYRDYGYGIVIVTARDGEAEQATREWLTNNIGHYDDFYIRQAGDRRKDYIVKEEILRKIIKKYYVYLWVDDRRQICTHIRSLGLQVLQVQDGRY